MERLRGAHMRRVICKLVPNLAHSLAQAAQHYLDSGPGWFRLLYLFVGQATYRAQLEPRAWTVWQAGLRSRHAEFEEIGILVQSLSHWTACCFCIINYVVVVSAISECSRLCAVN